MIDAPKARAEVPDDCEFIFLKCISTPDIVWKVLSNEFVYSL